MPRRQRGDTSSTLVVRTNSSPVSKSGDCAALKARRGRFESDAGHQFGDGTRVQTILARSSWWERYPLSPPIIPVKRTGCVHPTVNRTAAGSNPAAGANCRVRGNGFVFSVCNPGCRKNGFVFLSATSVVSAVFNDNLNASRRGPVRPSIAGHAREPPGSRACCGGLACITDSHVKQPGRETGLAEPQRV